MHVDLMFPSKYLKGANILQTKTGEITLTITAVRPDMLKKTDESKEKCWIVSLSGTDKLWVLNKTNAVRIADMYGKESDDWVGKAVTLTTEKVNAFGSVHDAIRVKPGTPQPQQQEAS